MSEEKKTDDQDWIECGIDRCKHILPTNDPSYTVREAHNQECHYKRVKEAREQAYRLNGWAHD